MSLADVIESVKRTERTLTVFNPGDDEGGDDDGADVPGQTGVVDALNATLADRNVEVRGETTESGRPRNVAVLDMDGVVLATVDVESLESMLEASGTNGTLGFDTREYADVLRHLQETTFTSYDRSRMLQATREIEDRAFRIGHGELHAGFQTLDRLREEGQLYRDLADRGLRVTAYAAPGGESPALPDGTVVTPDADEIATHWFVAYDGGGEPSQECALLAEERPDGYYGCWTYDPDVVDWILTHLREQYGTAFDGGK
ncbi:DICT sensory domain-containing protein [Salinarchaeum chitinilyticum]